MGLPEILIEFKTKAETAVRRSENGIVAVILADDTKSGDEYTSCSYATAADIVSSHWDAANKRYLNLIFAGSPKRVIAERIGKEEGYENALARLKNKRWNWLTVPGIAEENVRSISDWITAQRSTKMTFKAVLPNCATNNEGIVNFTTEGIKNGAFTYTAAEYCARIAGLLAGLPMTESATYQVLGEVSSITESLTPDKDIDDGKFILINDGEKVRVGRGVNSLAKLDGDKTEDMKKIKIIEGIDLIRDDIKTSFEENYIGVNNSYANKLIFISAVNQYFKTLERQGVLYDEYENLAEIDIDAQRDWLAGKYDVSEYTDEQILKAKTGSYVFVKAAVQFNDAIEDLHFTVNME